MHARPEMMWHFSCSFLCFIFLMKIIVIVIVTQTSIKRKQQEKLFVSIPQKTKLFNVLHTFHYYNCIYTCSVSECFLHAKREYHDEFDDAQMKIVGGGREIKSSFATFDVFNSEVDLTTCCFFTWKLFVVFNGKMFTRRNPLRVENYHWTRSNYT